MAQDSSSNLLAFRGAGAYNHPMTIRLTPDQEAIVTGAISQGLAKDAEEFVSNALRNQVEELAHQNELEDWLRTEVVAGHEEYMRDPSTGSTLAEVRAELLGD